MDSNALRYYLELELYKKDFWEYCLYHDFDFFSKRTFLKEIAEGFQDISDGKIKSLSISLPPRAGKSYITSLFCAWWLGNNSTKSVMRNSCTSSLFRKFSYDVRAIIKSAKYREVFDEIQLSPDKQNIDGWNLTSSKQVGYFGSGVGGTIIGFGCNLAITDDLFKDMMAALSDTVVESTHQWKQSAHDSRMEKNCPEIFIGTRWSKKDVIGKALENNQVEKSIVVPALTNEMKSFCEDVKTTDEYLKIKQKIDESIWEAEYMQNPVELKGLLFPKAELNHYNPKTVNVEELAEFRFTFIDPADEGGDDLSAPVGYLIGNKIYIVDAIYNKDGTDVNQPACVDYIINHKMNRAHIEGNSAWVLFAKQVKNKVIESNRSQCEVKIVKVMTNKHSRILAQSSFIKNNFVFRSDWETLPQYRRFYENLTSYNRIQEGGSKNKHEDAPDSCAGMAEFFAKYFAHLY